MKETIRELREKFVADFLPIGEGLRKDGFENWEIVRIFNRYIESKQNQFYR